MMMMSDYIDYTPHLITTKLNLKSMQNALLSNDYDKALELGTEALVELRMALTTVRVIREDTQSRR
jgi:hypothetical protein